MSKRDHDYERRLCRLDGLKPTTRDKWRAFHRLWRLAHGRGGYQDIEAGECFRVLFGGWRSIRLMDGSDSDGLVDRSHLPKFLRKSLLEGHRKRRLYAGHYEWVERDKVTANRCRDEHGIEVTPDEVAEVRRKVIRLARERAAAMDVPVPADDDDLLRLIRGGNRPAD